MLNAQDILNFWYEELDPKDWWVGGPAVDAAIKDRFEPVVLQALAGELYGWRRNATGRLAEIICLDQFPRNIYRGQARAFAGDAMALTLAQEVILGGHDASLTPDQKAFAFMPLMHSESLAIHTWAAQVFADAGLGGNLKALKEHSEVIEEFGRYPSRNAALGRVSTGAELAYLKDGKTWGQG